MPRDTAGLGSSPFDRLYWGNRSYFLLLPLLRCFSSRRSPHALSVMPGSLPAGCPIRISVGLRVFAPRHGFSQLVTSFFASESLGIPHAPFVVPFCLFSIQDGFTYNDFRLMYLTYRPGCLCRTVRSTLGFSRCCSRSATPYTESPASIMSLCPSR